MSPTEPSDVELGFRAAAAADFAAAAAHWARAAAAHPTDPALLTNLGEAYRRIGRLAESVETLGRAVALAPASPDAWFNYANALKEAGDWAAADAGYRRAVALRPAHAKAWFNLGNLQLADGRSPGAVESYRRATEYRPDWADAWKNLAAAWVATGDGDRAVGALERYARLSPGDPTLADRVTAAYLAAGRVDDARAALRGDTAGRPGDPTRELRLSLVCRPVPAGRADIRDDRGMLAHGVSLVPRLPANAPVWDRLSGLEPPTETVYHGADERPLREAFANAYAARFGRAEPPPPRSGVPHVGVVVTEGHEGVFDRCLGRIVDRLGTEGLRVSIAAPRGAVSVLRHLRSDRRCDYLTIPGRVDLASEAIRAAGIDLLHYWEVGTDATNYFLPFLRPARAQTATWGWPVTSGMGWVDAFVSCDWLEPPDAAAHYTERLVRLPSLPTLYDRPPAPARRPAPSDLGLPPDARLYLCPQNVRKLHPDMDPAIRDLLASDGRAVFGLIADARPRLTADLLDRLRPTVGREFDRVRVFPRLDRPGYLGLVSAAAVLVDPPHYGSGANTLADALACGVPLVAWEGRFHRGRWASGGFAALGVRGQTARSAGEWVRLAAATGSDADRRDHAARAMRAAAERFFAPGPAADELRAALLDEIERSRAT